MSDAQLNALWAEMTRTARPGARADLPHRGGGEPAARPGRATRCWAAGTTTPSAAASSARRDRAAIYGGFHRYVFAELIMSSEALPARS